MKTCSYCGYPDSHPLGITFNSEGICSGCTTHHEKYDSNWHHRSKKLQLIVNEYKSPSGNTYDCIVPINGGSDSYYTVFYVKYILKLNPLCVHYNSLYTNRTGHRNLSNLRVRLNVDVHMHIPGLPQVRELNKATLYTLSSMYWHVHAGATSFPVHIAFKYKIPLIIWGAHEAVEQVGMYSHDDEVEMTGRYREDHHLMGRDIDSLQQEFPALCKYNNDLYRYPAYSDLQKSGVRGIYLSNYIPWNQKLQHEFVAAKYGYKQKIYDSLFNGYEHPHCSFYNGIHDWLKYLKHGYGRFLDHLVRELRWGRVSPTTLPSLVGQHKPLMPRDNIKVFREFMEIPQNAFKHILESAKSNYAFSDSTERSNVYKLISSDGAERVTDARSVLKNLSGSFSKVPTMNSSNIPHIFLPGYPV